MRIRIRYFLLFLIIAIIVGYLFGCFWPFMSIGYMLDDNPVDKGQNLANFISVFGVLFTLCAVIVALFKDEIVGNFKKVDVSANMLYDTVEECTNESQGDADPMVEKYYNQIIFKNEGNVNALDCELLVEKMFFKGRSEVNPHKIDISNKKIQIGGQERTYIPKNGGHREANIIEIVSSANPNGNETSQLIIANNTVPVRDGTWTVDCCLNMSNATIKHYQIEIVWDGKWHDHKNNMQIQIKIKYN